MALPCCVRAHGVRRVFRELQLQPCGHPCPLRARTNWVCHWGRILRGLPVRFLFRVVCALVLAVGGLVRARLPLFHARIPRRIGASPVNDVQLTSPSFRCVSLPDFYLVSCSLECTWLTWPVFFRLTPCLVPKVKASGHSPPRHTRPAPAQSTSSSQASLPRPTTTV